METHNRGSMAKRYFVFLWLSTLPFYGGGATAQNDSSRIRVSVVLVQLSVAVTDRKGNYVSGLRPEDFSIVEDKIPEKIATFGEGNEPTRRLIDIGSGKPLAQHASKIVAPTGEQAITGGSPYH